MWRPDSDDDEVHVPAEVEEQVSLIKDAITERWEATPEALEARAKEQAWLAGIRAVNEEYPDAADGGLVPEDVVAMLRHLRAEAEESRTLAIIRLDRMIKDRYDRYKLFRRALLNVGPEQEDE